MEDKEAREKIPDSFRIPLRALLWEYGIYKTVKQDEIIDTMFFNGYRKLPKNKPPDNQLSKFLRPMVIHSALDIEKKLRDHDKQKGNSWKNCSIDYLKDKLREEFAEWLSRNEPTELLDLMAVAMMLYCRLVEDLGAGSPSPKGS